MKRTPRFLVIFSIGASLTLFCAPVRAQWVRWEFSAGGNGHFYKAVAVTNGISWRQADEVAHAEGGYLATITSVEENDFVFSLVDSPAFFSTNNGAGPALGGFQRSGSAEPGGGWTWVSGEPWVYTNWYSSQPDNNGTPPLSSEEKLQFFSNIPSTPASTWNDCNTDATNVGGYVIERAGPYEYQFVVEKLWDFSGEYHVVTGESDETTALIHAPSGLVSGTESGVTTNGTVGFFGTATINGRVLTTPSGIVMRNRFIFVGNGRYLDDGTSYHLEANVKGDYHLGSDSLIGSLKGRVCFTRHGDTDCRTGTIPISLTLQPDMDGTWQLVLDINGDRRLSGNATATLSNGKTVSFSCSGTKSKAGVSHLRLAGIGDAVGAKLIVTLGGAGELRKITGKVFGQKILVLR